MTVSVDSPGRYALPEGVARVFVADPLVADVQVLSAKQMLVLGKMPGAADVVLFDAKGERLDTVRVTVGNGRAGVVTLYSGPERYSFRCAARCEQVPMLGDGRLASFNELINNVQLRSNAGRPGQITETVVEVPQSAPAEQPAQAQAQAQPQLATAPPAEPAS